MILNRTWPSYPITLAGRHREKAIDYLLARLMPFS
jgi:hypothetical protein